MGRSVKVYNAYPREVRVRVDATVTKNRNEASSRSGNLSLNTGLVDPEFSCSAGAAAGASSEKRMSQEFHNLKEPGFFKLGRNEATTVSPEVEDGKSVYISVHIVTDDGDKLVFAEDVPFDPVKKASVIISKTGSLVSAKDPGTPWIDMNGVDHSKQCENCWDISQACPDCLLEAALDEMYNIIDELVKAESRPTLDLVELYSELEQKEAANTEIVAEIKSLARCYWETEAKTKTAVREVEKYGQHLIKASDVFKKNGKIKEFLADVKDTRAVNDALKDCYDGHSNIEQQLSSVDLKVTQALRDGGVDKSKSFPSQLLIADSTFANVLRALNENPVGGLIGVLWAINGLGLIGVAEIIAMRTRSTRKNLLDVGTSLKPVRQHLTRITSVVENVDTRLEETITAEENFRQLHGEKSSKLEYKMLPGRMKKSNSLTLSADRMKINAQRLVGACKAYQSLSGKALMTPDEELRIRQEFQITNEPEPEPEPEPVSDR